MESEGDAHLGRTVQHRSRVARNPSAPNLRQVQPGPGRAPNGTVSEHLIGEIAAAARVGKRTTRTGLLIAGYALLAVVVIAIFGSSGRGVRDLRSQVVASVTTPAATIAGFYLGAQTAGKKGTTSGRGQAAAGKPTQPAAGSPDAGGVGLAAHGGMVRPDPGNPRNAGNFQAS